MKLKIKTTALAAAFISMIGMSGCSSDTVGFFPELEYYCSGESYTEISQMHKDDYIETFFSSEENTHTGFIAIIRPVEVSFYHRYRTLNDPDDVYRDGFAIYKCSVESVSSVYNTCGSLNEKTVSVRVREFLEPRNEKTDKKVAEEVGIIKDGKVVLGTYRIPDKYINSTDYRVLLLPHAVCMPEEGSYYAFLWKIEEDGDVFRCAVLCPADDGLYEKMKKQMSLPGEVVEQMATFRKFIDSKDLKLN